MVDLSDEFLNLTEGKCFMLDRMGKLLVPAVLAGLLAGCGGSDAPVVERPPEASKSISVAGKVIDGYVVGSTVWLDLDGNGRFDDNLEPSVVSTESGMLKCLLERLMKTLGSLRKPIKCHLRHRLRHYLMMISVTFRH